MALFFSSTENQKTVVESKRRKSLHFGKIWILNLIQLNCIRLSPNSSYRMVQKTSMCFSCYCHFQKMNSERSKLYRVFVERSKYKKRECDELSFFFGISKKHN